MCVYVCVSTDTHIKILKQNMTSVWASCSSEDPPPYVEPSCGACHSDSPWFLLLSELLFTHKTPQFQPVLGLLKALPPRSCPGLCQQPSPPHCQPVGTIFYLLSLLGRQITWHICFLGKVNPSMLHFTSLEHWNKDQTHHRPQESPGARAVPDSMPCPPSAPPGLPWNTKIWGRVGCGTYATSWSVCIHIHTYL